MQPSWAVDSLDWVIDNVSIDSSRVRSCYRSIIRAGIVAEDKTGGLLAARDYFRTKLKFKAVAGRERKGTGRAAVG